MKASLLSWPLDDGWHGSDSEKLIKLLERLSRGEQASTAKLLRELETWLDAAPLRAADPIFGIECIAWCHALPQLAQLLPAAPWSQLLEQVESVAEQSPGLNVWDQPLAHQLLAGELPLTLGFTFPELPKSSKLIDQARDQLSGGMIELLDGEGLPTARHLEVTRPLLACWTRCGFIGRSMKSAILNDDAWTQFEWYMLQCLRLTRPDGSHAFSQGLAGAYCAPLFEAALTLTGDRADRRIADTSLPRRKRPSNAPKNAPKSTSKPSVNSEWAAVSVLRRSWSRGAEQLAITYRNQQLNWELNSGNLTLWSGSAVPDIKIDGRPLASTGEWSEVCYVSDEDGDYLELELPVGKDRMVQRQVLLARKDRFLFVADALLGDQEANIEYSHNIPLSPGVQFQAAKGTREGFLVAKRRVALVMPLALPEWRSEKAAGTLEGVDGQLQLQMKTQRSRLYAPLFIDLDPNRIRKQLTWRRLTIAQQLEPQPMDVAAGFRVQVGQRQWLIYRSLARIANRSLLGQNICCEFIASRFTPAGEVDHLVEIE